MAYTTPDRLKLVMAGDYNAAGPDTPASLSEEALLDAIGRAESRVDARLSRQYAVPFDPPGDLIVSVTEGLAAFYATLTARRGAPVDREDPARLRYEDALKMLDQLASGDLVIGSVDTSTGEVGSVQPYYGDLFVPEDFHLGYGA